MPSVIFDSDTLGSVSISCKQPVGFVPLTSMYMVLRLVTSMLVYPVAVPLEPLILSVIVKLKSLFT